MNRSFLVFFIFCFQISPLAPPLALLLSNNMKQFFSFFFITITTTPINIPAVSVFHQEQRWENTLGLGTDITDNQTKGHSTRWWHASVREQTDAHWSHFNTTSSLRSGWDVSRSGPSFEASLSPETIQWTQYITSFNTDNVVQNRSY